MSLTKLIILKFIFLLVVSCYSINKVTTIDNETGYYPARKSREATITRSIKVDPDTLRNLVVVNNSEYIRGMAINMKYFKEVKDFNDLEKDLIAEGYEVKGRLNLGSLDHYIKYINNNPLTVLYMDRRKDGNKMYAELKLYEPVNGEDIFVSEIFLNMIYDGWTDKGTTYPLFNSLIDYLKGLE